MLRMIAAFQILLLVAVCVIPEGRQLMLRPINTDSHCGCSAESRASGNCCCAAKAAAASDESISPCCRRAAAKGACCSSNSEKSCCSNSADSSDSEEPGGQLTSCPCGSEAYEIFVILMPRLRTDSVGLPVVDTVVDRITVENDRSATADLQPELPPPRNLPC